MCNVGPKLDRYYTHTHTHLSRSLFHKCTPPPPSTPNKRYQELTSVPFPTATAEGPQQVDTGETILRAVVRPFRTLVNVRLARHATETCTGARAPEGLEALQTRAVVQTRVRCALVAVRLAKLALVARIWKQSKENEEEQEEDDEEEERFAERFPNEIHDGNKRSQLFVFVLCRVQSRSP